ncbi:MAG: hypothetical protein ABR551_07395 [Gemmatimonadales bacterium]
MSQAPGPSPGMAALLYLALFLGGGLLGSQLARAMAPGSGLAELVSFLALPAAFMVGIIAWAGAALPAMVRGLVRMIRDGGRRSRSDGRLDEPVIVPGSFAFVPVALVITGGAGLLVAILSRTHSFLAVLGLYLLIGAGYGSLCWRLARIGWLQFPRE